MKNNPIEILDAWSDRNVLADTFANAMRGPSKRKPNPDETINYENIPVNTEVIIRKTIKG